MLDHPLVHIQDIQLTTATFCCGLCAVVFGKDEGGGPFTFSESLVHNVVAIQREWISNPLLNLVQPTLEPYYLRPLVHLCISGKRSLLHNRDHCA